MIWAKWHWYCTSDTGNHLNPKSTTLIITDGDQIKTGRLFCRWWNISAATDTTVNSEIQTISTQVHSLSHGKGLIQ